MTSSSEAGADLSVGEVMLGSLLDASHLLPPDDVGPVARRKAALAGINDVVLYLVDLDQRVLLPFGHDDDGEPLSIDGTRAGRAYRRSEVVKGDRLGGDTRTWFPLLDGTSRVGVMGAYVDDDTVSLVRGRQLAALVAELLVTKSVYGDHLLQAARTKPLTLAAELRWGAMPPLTCSSPLVTIAGALEPAHEIAGDAFDYALNGDQLHFAIFDAMGHGLTASRLADLAVYSYRHSRRIGLGLEETYRAMDEAIEGEFGEDYFVTAHLATLDLPSGRLRSVNAGHPRPMVLRDDTHVSELDCNTSPPLGFGDRQAEVTEAVLQGGDSLLFVSDGILEARSPSGEQFGHERLADHLVRAFAAGETAPETVRRLTQAVLDHRSDLLDDDATVVLVRWAGRGAGDHPGPA